VAWLILLVAPPGFNYFSIDDMAAAKPIISPEPVVARFQTVLKGEERERMDMCVCVIGGMSGFACPPLYTIFALKDGTETE
jgi:hypothetical protein